jgi:maltose O-acetyltransferase
MEVPSSGGGPGGISRMQRFLQLHREETTGLHWRLLLARLVVAPLPLHVGSRVRSAALRWAGFRIGRGTVMWGMPTITGLAGLYDNLDVGSECWFNEGCVLDLGARITIGDRVALGHQVIVMTTSHEVGSEERRAGAMHARPVSIGAGAWIGTRSVILPGVEVGAGAIVGAGALVNAHVPPGTVVGGVPARQVRDLGANAPDPAPSPLLEEAG